MFFRIKRKIRFETLTIRLTFSPSDDAPCEMMNAHADDVVAAVEQRYDKFQDEPFEIIAHDILDMYRRLACVEVESETGEVSVCCFAEEFNNECE